MYNVTARKRMSNKYQFIVLRKILSSMHFFIQLFGLWPYKINNSSRDMKYSPLKVVYSIVVPVLVLYTYFTFARSFLAKSRRNIFFQSQTMEVITSLYSIIIILSYGSLYVKQHLTFNKTKLVYLKCLDIIELVKEYPYENVDLRKYILFFFVKSIGFEILTFSVFWFNMSRSSDVLVSNPLVPLFLYSPIFVIRLGENTFYGVVLVIDMVFKQLNKSLVDIVITMKETRAYPETDLQFIEKCCCFSDELNKLSKLHFKLGEVTKAFNSIFNFQLLLWIILQLGVLLIRCFFQYIAIVNLLKNYDSFAVVLNFLIFGGAVVAWFEILSTSYACESLVNEVNKKFL